MCILFVYNGCNNKESDYSLILVSNRDEYYNRPTLNMAPWSEDPDVFGGRDLEVKDGGSWLAISPLRRKLGVILNLPRTPKPNAKSRGRIVADFVKGETPLKDYVENIKTYVKECNDFVFVAIDIDDVTPSIQTYSNASDCLNTHTDTYLGFGNSLLDSPLTKVEAGKIELKKICEKFNKIYNKQELVKELIELLKSEKKHLPDPELEKRRPSWYEQLSSIFVRIPEGGYGTRTHTLVLVTKIGHIDVVELTMQTPIDPMKPNWVQTDFQFDMQSHL